MGDSGTAENQAVDEKSAKKRQNSYLALISHGRRALQVFGEDLLNLDLLLRASAMAYITLLSIVPSLAVSFSLVSIFTSVGQRSELMDDLKIWLLSKLTEGTGQEVAAALERYVANLDLTHVGLTGLLSLLLTLIMLLRQIEITLNRIFRVKCHRHILMRLLYFCSSLGIGAILITSVYELIERIGFSQNALWHVPSQHETNPIWLFLKGSAISWVFFFGVYKLIPNCQVKTAAAMVGALVTSLLFHLASYGFTLYVKYIANYQVIYGALATLPLFLLWLYLGWVIILLGGVIAWRVEHGIDPFGA